MAASLPHHHVARPRLVRLLERAPVGVVEAGGGFGKTTLAAEAARAWGVPQVRVGFDQGDDDPGVLAMRLSRALARAGLSDAAASIGTPTDPDETVEAFLDAVARERDPVLVVLDDVHHVGRSAKLVARMADGLPEPGRMLLLARRLPDDLAGLRRSGQVVTVSGADLAFTVDETDMVCTKELGRPVSRREAEALHRATGGWPVAVVLLGRALERGLPVDLAGTTEGALVHLIEEQVGTLPEDLRDAVRQLAHVRSLTPAVAEAVTGIPGVLEEAILAGVPFAPRPDGRWELPGPVQEHLAGSRPMLIDTARRAAPALVAQGDVGVALEMLMVGGDEVAAAAALAGLTPEQADRLDITEVAPTVRALSSDALRQHPEALVHLARACEAPARTRERAEALERALGLAADRPSVRREVEAEMARDLVRDRKPEEAERLARRVLDEAPPEEAATRARALDVVGRVRAYLGDRDALAEAEPLLEEAYQLFRALGRRSWAAQVVIPLAFYVHHARGRDELALARMDEALAELPGRDRYRAVVLTFRADVLVDRGRYDEAEADLREASEIADRLHDERVLGYVHWTSARMASQAGDAERTRAELSEAEAHGGDWLDHETGAGFLADAADFLSRAGDAAAAERYLQRARDRAVTPIRELGLAEAAVAARQGDPAEADRLLAGLEADPSVAPRDRWRLTLLRAEAARRAGDPVAGELARRAFDQARAIGAPEVPFVREPAIAERLQELIDAPTEAGAAIRALGRFEVRRGGAPVELPAGQPAMLLKIVVAAGGRIPADAAIETLWPWTAPAPGRNRLRVVLARLRKAVGDLVVRDGDALALAEGVDVDAVRFERLGRRALAGDGPGPARSALALYGGTFLDDEPYAAWASAPRERLAGLHLALLDLLARDASERGDVDEAIRLREQAIAADRFDEGRYLALARLLLRQGRRGRALEVLRRAGAALRELDLDTSPEHRELVRAARS